MGSGRLLVASIYVVLSFSVSTCFANTRETVLERSVKVVEEKLSFLYNSSSLPTIKADGSFDEVDYNDQGRAAWMTVDHLTYISFYALRYHMSGDASIREENLDIVTRGLDFWHVRRPVAPNNWFNQIGAPRWLRDILVLVHDKIPSTTRDAILEMMNAESANGKGANLLWSADLMFYHGILTENLDQSAEAMRRIRDEIKTGLDQGVQADGTFYQHSRRMQNLHYGKHFLDIAAELAWTNRDTEFALELGQIQTLRQLIFGGNVWLTRGKGTTPVCLDRSVSRRNVAYDQSANLTAPLTYLMEADPSFALPYQAVIDSYNTVKPTVDGVKNFHFGELLARQDADFTLALKTLSSITLRTEKINNENLIGWKYMHYGNHWVMKQGDEYGELMPVLRWDRLPGAVYTSSVDQIDARSLGGSIVLNDKSLTVLNTGFSSELGNPTFTRYFFTSDDLLFSIVSPIKNPPSDDLYISMDQCRYRGRYGVDRDASRRYFIKQGLGSESDIPGIFHNSVVYLPGDNVRLESEAQTQSGSWGLINEQYDSTTTVTEEIFNVRAKIQDPSLPSSYMLRMAGTKNLPEGAPEVRYVAEDGLILEYKGTTFAVLLEPNKVYPGGHAAETPAVLAFDGDQVSASFLDSQKIIGQRWRARVKNTALAQRKVARAEASISITGNSKGVILSASTSSVGLVFYIHEGELYLELRKGKFNLFLKAPIEAGNNRKVGWSVDSFTNHVQLFIDREVVAESRDVEISEVYGRASGWVGEPSKETGMIEIQGQPLRFQGRIHYVHVEPDRAGLVEMKEEYSVQYAGTNYEIPLTEQGVHFDPLEFPSVAPIGPIPVIPTPAPVAPTPPPPTPSGGTCSKRGKPCGGLTALSCCGTLECRLNLSGTRLECQKQCAKQHRKCGKHRQCCGDLECRWPSRDASNRQCLPPPTQCAAVGRRCGDNTLCCGDATCRGFVLKTCRT